MTVPVDPIAIALAVARALDTLGIIHTIGGSIASSIAGEPRSTLDIDVAALRESDVPALVSALSADFYVNDEALHRAVRERSSANIIHQATQLKVVIFVAGVIEEARGCAARGSQAGRYAGRGGGAGQARLPDRGRRDRGHRRLTIASLAHSVLTVTHGRTRKPRVTARLRASSYE